MLASFTAKRPSVEEGLAAGKSLREKVRRAEHAGYHASSDRQDPVAILERQNATRVQKLVPVRYARMLASPFAFLRGSAAVMSADLAATPASGLQVVACGDMHVANFGVYASAERRLVFSINDFDEVHPGPWEWDLKRLVASAAVAVRFMGGDKVAAADAARAVVRSYRKRIGRYAEMGYLQVWYDRIDAEKIVDTLPPRLQRNARRILDKARAKGHVQVLEKLTEQVPGQEPRIIEDVPLIVRETHTEAGIPIDVALDAMLRAYLESLTDDRRRLLSRYRIVDVARKVVGVGSVGTGCWVILLQGVDSDDPLFLQVKEAQASVLEPYVDQGLPFENHGRRVVAGQRVAQGSPDIFLGWGELAGKHFYVRQLADMKGGISFDQGGIQPDGLKEYCRLCGWALALAHAKSGNAARIAGYCGNSDELDGALATFALAYARQTDKDHHALDQARRSGRIQVASEEVAK
jgi:uncharacterized protein (DUF2252 family)